MACGLNLELGWEGLGRVIRSKDAKGSVHVEDAIRLEVRLLPVLPEEAMRDLLRQRLREKGWTDQPDGTMLKVLESGAEARLESDASAVMLRVKSDKTLSARVQVSVTSRGKSDAEVTREADAALEQQGQEKLKVMVERQREEMEQEHLRTLSAHEPELRAELQEALNRTYKSALERRARELGEVESVKESGDPRGSYEITVVVRA